MGEGREEGREKRTREWRDREAETIGLKKGRREGEGKGEGKRDRKSEFSVTQVNRLTVKVKPLSAVKKEKERGKEEGEGGKRKTRSLQSVLPHIIHTYKHVLVKRSWHMCVL